MRGVKLSCTNISLITWSLNGETHTEVVCMSPGSGELSSTMVNLRYNTPLGSEEDRGINESRSKVRKAVQELFESDIMTVDKSAKMECQHFETSNSSRKEETE